MRAALFIAYNGSEDNPVSGSAIVDYYNLNKRALEPVLQKLSNKGIIISIKGAKGGYYMPQPEKKTLRDVIEVFSSKKAANIQRENGYDTILNEKLTLCHEQWLEKLSDISFKELCFNAKKSEIMPLETPILNFAI